MCSDPSNHKQYPPRNVKKDTCARCGLLFPVAELHSLGMCGPCCDQTQHEEDQLMEMNRDEHS